MSAKAPELPSLPIVSAMSTEQDSVMDRYFGALRTKDVILDFQQKVLFILMSNEFL